MNLPVLLLLVLHFVLLGGIVLLIPRIGRRGLLFGVYVGEQNALSDGARQLTRAFTLWLAPAFALELAGCLALHGAGYSQAALFCAPWLLLLSTFAAYLAAHRRARAFAVEPSRASVASLDDGLRPTSLALPALTLLVGVAASLYAFGYAWRHYGELPERIPIHFDLAGRADGFAEKSVASVFVLPGLTFAMSIGLSGLCFVVARARRMLRVSGDPASARAQARFRGALTAYVCCVVGVTIALLTALSVGVVDAALSGAGLEGTVNAMLIGLLVVAFGGLPILLMLGQGGARLEGASAAAPLPDALANDRYWKLGLLYFNPEDPSFLVEHRFGLGYTLNFANRTAVVSVIGLVALAVAASIAAAWL